MSENALGKADSGTDSSNKQPLVECDTCGEEFSCTQYRINRSENLYCSQECQHEGLRGRTGEEHSNYNRVTYECDNCGEEMRRKPSRVEKYEFLYCSRECQYDHDGRGNAISEKLTKEKVEIECEWCEKAFQVIPSREDTARFCNVECRRAFIRNRTGKEHPLWEDNKANNFGENWDELAKAIREKYNRECWSCGVDESELYRKLDVHHIKPRREFDDVSEANTEDNLIPLCMSCHQKWESLPVRPQL